MWIQGRLDSLRVALWAGLPSVEPDANLARLVSVMLADESMKSLTPEEAAEKVGREVALYLLSAPGYDLKTLPL